MPKESATLLLRSALWQITAACAFWIIMYTLVRLGTFKWTNEITLSMYVAIPAAVIVMGQLIVNAHVQRSGYVKDYALKFRTDKDLSESFHFLVVNYGNRLYGLFERPIEQLTPDEKKELEIAQADVPPDLRFFHPTHIGVLQERRLDNLLGFFDTLGYDYKRGLVSIKDVSALFGVQLDHFLQREAIQAYLTHVKKKWPAAKTFHEDYMAPIPYRFLDILLRHHKQHCIEEGKRLVQTEEKNV